MSGVAPPRRSRVDVGSAGGQRLSCRVSCADDIELVRWQAGRSGRQAPQGSKPGRRTNADLMVLAPYLYMTFQHPLANASDEPCRPAQRSGRRKPRSDRPYMRRYEHPRPNVPGIAASAVRLFNGSTRRTQVTEGTTVAGDPVTRPRIALRTPHKSAFVLCVDRRSCVREVIQPNASSSLRTMVPAPNTLASYKAG